MGFDITTRVEKRIRTHYSIDKRNDEKNPKKEVLVPLKALARNIENAHNLAEQKKIITGVPSHTLRNFQAALQERSTKKITGAYVLEAYAKLFPMLEVQVMRGSIPQNYLAALSKSPIKVIAFRIVLERFSELYGLADKEEWKHLVASILDTTLFNNALLLISLGDHITCMTESVKLLCKVLEPLNEVNVFLELEHWSWTREPLLLKNVLSYSVTPVLWDKPAMLGNRRDDTPSEKERNKEREEETKKLYKPKPTAWRRLLGQNAKDWFEEERYHYCYTNPQLKKLAKEIDTTASSYKAMYVTMANSPSINTYLNAQQLIVELLSKQLNSQEVL